MYLESRSQVLALFRKILRMAGTWKAVDPAETVAERKYIAEEASHLFRKNRDLSDPEEIAERIMEAEARIEMALHYRNPFPRISNVPPFSMTRGRGREESQLKRIRTTPIHLKSYKDT